MRQGVRVSAINEYRQYVLSVNHAALTDGDSGTSNTIVTTIDVS
jgi:hypothetical protein